MSSQVQYDRFFSSVALPQRLPSFRRTALLLVGVPLFVVVGFATLILLSATTRYVKLHFLGTDRYNNIPRPIHRSKRSLLFGHVGEFSEASPGQMHVQWRDELNSAVFVFRGIMYVPFVLLADPKAMLHVLGTFNAYSYPKTNTVRAVLRAALGNGLLVEEGDVHKRQRKVIQPAFSVNAIRDLLPIFTKYSQSLVEKMGDIVDRSQNPKGGPDGVTRPFCGQSRYALEPSRPGIPVLDVNYWITRAALDIIGDAGFSYRFNSLTVDVDPGAPQSKLETVGNSLRKAFDETLKHSTAPGVGLFLQFYLSSFPYLGWVQTLSTKRNQKQKYASAQLKQISVDIISRKKLEIQREMQSEKALRGGVTSGGGLTKADFDEQNIVREGSTGKDLLHLMMRANMAHDISAKEKLEDDELVGQMTTLLVAGHETTSAQTAYTLWALAQHPEVQTKLRAEIHDHFGKQMTNDVGYEQLMSMDYLDRVCKEMLRFNSAVPNTVRMAAKDDVIPLSKPYPTRDGKSTFQSIQIQKGQILQIPIYAINLSSDIWGPTAHQFDPDRWIDLPAAARQNGLPLHLMSFLSGPRACIGDRFAIAEFKVMLCYLIGHFSYQTVSGWQVDQKQDLVSLPGVAGQEEIGSQLPLRVSRV